MIQTPQKLSALWLFAILNYLYCDVVGLMDTHLLTQYLAGKVGGMDMTPQFLFCASLLMEIPIAMVLLSLLLGYNANRWANIGAGLMMTCVQMATLFLGEVTNYYIFFSCIEIASTLYIVWLAWQWTKA